MSSNRLPSPIQELPQHDLEGAAYIATADLLQSLGLSRSTFYSRLKELEFTPRRIKQSTYLTVEQALELVSYVDFLSRGGNLQGWKDKKSALSTQVEQSELVALESPEAEETVAVDLNNLRFLSEAAEKGWWLPTGTLAALLDVTHGTIARQGQEFIAYGFHFSRTQHRWKGSIQWSVRVVREP